MSFLYALRHCRKLNEPPSQAACRACYWFALPRWSARRIYAPLHRHGMGIVGLSHAARVRSSEQGLLHDAVPFSSAKSSPRSNLDASRRYCRFVRPMCFLSVAAWPRPLRRVLTTPGRRRTITKSKCPRAESPLNQSGAGMLLSLCASRSQSFGDAFAARSTAATAMKTQRCRSWMALKPLLPADGELLFGFLPCLYPAVGDWLATRSQPDTFPILGSRRYSTMLRASWLPRPGRAARTKS